MLILSLIVPGWILTTIYLQGIVPKNYVPWDQAVQILHTGNVSRITQAHSLFVTFTLKNGSFVTMKEPHIDDIGREIAKCGDPCRNVIYATE